MALLSKIFYWLFPRMRPEQKLLAFNRQYLLDAQFRFSNKLFEHRSDAALAHIMSALDVAQNLEMLAAANMPVSPNMKEQYALVQGRISAFRDLAAWIARSVDPVDYKNRVGGGSSGEIVAMKTKSKSRAGMAGPAL